jgi:predicted dehydrogenase
LAEFSFNGHTAFGHSDQTVIAGSKGVIHSTGPSLTRQQVALFLAAGQSHPRLEGCWFPDGFQGTMGELLCAIEEKREPENSGANNLPSLALAFAAIRSADTGTPVVPGSIRKIN